MRNKNINSKFNFLYTLLWINMFKNVKKIPLCSRFFLSLFFSLIFFLYGAPQVLAMEHKDKEDSSKAPEIKKKEDFTNILAIKSQGNRTIIAARILERLEEELCRDFEDGVNKISIAKSFNTMAASYTGAFLLITLCMQELAVAEEEKETNQSKCKSSGLVRFFSDTISKFYIEETSTSSSPHGSPYKLHQTRNLFFEGALLITIAIIAYFYDIDFKSDKNIDYNDIDFKKKNYNNLQDKMGELCHETYLSKISNRILIPVRVPNNPQPYVFDSQSAKTSSIDNYLCKDILAVALCDGIFFDTATMFNERKEDRVFYSGNSAQDQRKNGIAELPDPARLALNKEKEINSNPKKNFLVFMIDTQTCNEDFASTMGIDNVRIIHLNIVPAMHNASDISIHDVQKEKLERLRNIADDYWTANKNKKEIRAILVHLTKFWMRKGAIYKAGDEKLHKLNIESGIYERGIKINLSNLNIQNSDLDFVQEKVNSINSDATKLDLSGNIIDSEGVEKLDDILKKCPQIKDLKLDQNKINDEGIKKICKSLCLLNLENLSLQKCGITEKGYMYICTLFKKRETLISSIPEIDMRDNKEISPNCAISQRHPKIRLL